VTGQENFELSDELLQDREIIRFRIRYRTGITHKMRVMWGSRAYDIQRIEEPDNTGREMGLVCLEVPYDGS
jgi:SPP1 family predicted phage head-tail adaptor